MPSHDLSLLALLSVKGTTRHSYTRAAFNLSLVSDMEVSPTERTR